MGHDCRRRRLLKPTRNAQVEALDSRVPLIATAATAISSERGHMCTHDANPCGFLDPHNPRVPIPKSAGMGFARVGCGLGLSDPWVTRDRP